MARKSPTRRKAFRGNAKSKRKISGRAKKNWLVNQRRGEILGRIAHENTEDTSSLRGGKGKLGNRKDRKVQLGSEFRDSIKKDLIEDGTFISDHFYRMLNKSISGKQIRIPIELKRGGNYNKQEANPIFANRLKRMQEIHDKKSADYASDDNRYSNFEYAAKVAEPFKDPIDKVFAMLMGIKLARLAELSKEGKVPNNESVDDSHLDKDTYSVLWSSYRELHQ